jgi:DNA adenine methylase
VKAFARVRDRWRSRHAGDGARSPLLAARGTTFRPLLKWPGGKRREWPQIEPFLPKDVRDFVDPFMGGCAPFGLTKFSGHAYLNDKHERLVDLHVRVQRGDAALFREMAALGDAWDAQAAVARRQEKEFRRLVEAARAGGRVRTDSDGVRASLEDKAARLAKLEVKHGMRFDAAQLAEHCETAVRSAFYFGVRAEERSATGARAAACFLFVRDFCYGSMFRSNAAGEFNIPYGGTSYNAKSFLARLEQLRGPQARQAFARTTFFSLDFEEFLDARRASLGPNDLVFLDPPYDSDFSTYGANAFGLPDQERLAAALSKITTPWLLVIKETPEIHRLYADAMKRGSFGKQYGYNVRGRNERATRHLVVANFVPPRMAAAGGAS